jgi:hypothetical protein
LQTFRKQLYRAQPHEQYSQFQYLNQFSQGYNINQQPSNLSDRGNQTQQQPKQPIKYNSYGVHGVNKHISKSSPQEEGFIFCPKFSTKNI